MSYLLYVVNSLELYLLTSTPSTIISPLVGESIPPNMFNIVDFPAPLAPATTTNSPLFIEKSTPLSASISTSPIL